jgi:hypothetical protein
VQEPHFVILRCGEKGRGCSGGRLFVGQMVEPTSLLQTGEGPSAHEQHVCIFRSKRGASRAGMQTGAAGCALLGPLLLLRHLQSVQLDVCSACAVVPWVGLFVRLVAQPALFARGSVHCVLSYSRLTFVPCPADLL